ncbi:MAG: VOC family protein [Patescibacteria group bacterium]
MFKNSTSFNVLYTNDITNTRRFFSGFGLEIQELDAEKVVVIFGSFELHFILRSAESTKDYQYITEVKNCGQGIIFYIQTTDIDGAKELIEKHGGVIKSPIFTNHWNCRELLFEDPNGYKFAVFQEV